MRIKKAIGISFIILLCAVVITSISVTIALSDRMKATSDTLAKFRAYMTGSSHGFEPLVAYIIPSDDAHQVN